MTTHDWEPLPVPLAQRMTDKEIDEGLDLILRASGSALRHYSMQKTLDDMRAALRCVIALAGAKS